MSNLNVDALKKLFPKNTAHRKGGKANGANRKRVQVMLPPDTLARLDELIEHDEQARSAAVALGVEWLCLLLASPKEPEDADRVLRMLYSIEHRNTIDFNIGWLFGSADRQP